MLFFYIDLSFIVIITDLEHFIDTKYDKITNCYPSLDDPSLSKEEEN